MESNIFDALYEGDLQGILKLLESQPEQANAIRIEDGMTPLILACEAADAELVAALLEAGADPKECPEDGETALHVAAFEPSAECASLVLRANADPNARTVEGKTPLMNAAQSGSSEVVESLLAAGANARAVDDFGRSALHWASVGEHDHGAIVRVLRAAGVDVDQINKNNDTALDYARAMEKPNLEYELKGR